MASQIVLLDQSRSGGCLLQKLLSQQPKLTHLDHPFSASRGTQAQWLINQDSVTAETRMPDSDRSKFDEQVNHGIETWENAFKGAQESGRILMVHDHAFNAAKPETIISMYEKTVSHALPDTHNTSGIPSSLLLNPGTIPVLTIRDPRVAVPSAFKVLCDMGMPHGSGRPNFTISTSLLWVRSLYEYYESNGLKPVVVDGDDIMTDPDFVKRLCVRLGLDGQQVLWSWPTPTPEEREKLHPAYYASQRVLIEAGRVRPDRAAVNRNLDAEVEEWRQDFGEDASVVGQMIECALSHYEWLRERRFRG